VEDFLENKTPPPNPSTLSLFYFLYFTIIVSYILIIIIIIIIKRWRSWNSWNTFSEKICGQKSKKLFFEKDKDFLWIDLKQGPPPPTPPTPPPFTITPGGVWNFKDTMLNALGHVKNVQNFKMLTRAPPHTS